MKNEISIVNQNFLQLKVSHLIWTSVGIDVNKDVELINAYMFYARHLNFYYCFFACELSTFSKVLSPLQSLVIYAAR